MKIKVGVYSCYEQTYKRVYPDVIKRLYGKSFPLANVTYAVKDISDNGKRNIQSQRSLDIPTRALYIYENGEMRHIVVTSNTNKDYDKALEKQRDPTAKYIFDRKSADYHGNAYFKQGLPKYFNYYFELKKDNPKLKLSFYILDTDKSIPHNLFNTLTWRELQTIGFDILNIDEIKFTKYEEKTGSKIIDKHNIKFSSFIKYINDISAISHKNKGNRPSFLQCIEHCELDKEKNEIFYIDKYTYTFKALSAQGYDAFFRVLCLKTLADKENHSIEFRLGKQYFAYDEKEKKVSDKLTAPIIECFKNFNTSIHYLTNEEFMEEKNRWERAYNEHKRKNDTRNQGLFRSNLYKKGVPIKCVICGNDEPNDLVAAHLWEVTDIKHATAKTINDFLTINSLEDLVDQTSPHKTDLFFKKYCITNSGENGVWLCRNHHNNFDSNCFTFETLTGEVHILRFPSHNAMLRFKSEYESANPRIPASVMTKATQCCLRMRNIPFSI